MRQKGNSSIFVLILVLLALIIGASAASYYILQSQGKAPAIPTQVTYVPTQATPVPANSGNISDDDEIETIESELEATLTGDIDTDITELNSSASSL